MLHRQVEDSMNWSTGILGLGSVAVDELIFAEYAPPNQKTPVRHRERHFGGQTATALVAATRLGAQCAYAGILGTDDLSASAIENMRSIGIDLQYLRQNSHAFAVQSLIIVDEENQTRNIYYHRSPFSGAAIDWPPEEVVQACQILLVDQHGIPGMTRAAAIARSTGIPVISDLETFSPGIEKLFALIDHLIVPESFAQMYTGETPPSQATAALWTPERAAVVVTCGEAGCWFMGQNMHQPEHYSAFLVQVVDTTGCGDVFHGAYAAGLLRGMTLHERIRMASAAAAIKASKRGGQSGCPTRSELNAFLNNG
jgi:sulfofructose kinase